MKNQIELLEFGNCDILNVKKCHFCWQHTGKARAGGIGITDEYFKGHGRDPEKGGGFRNKGGGKESFGHEGGQGRKRSFNCLYACGYPVIVFLLCPFFRKTDRLCFAGMV